MVAYVTSGYQIGYNCQQTKSMLLAYIHEIVTTFQLGKNVILAHQFQVFQGGENKVNLISICVNNMISIFPNIHFVPILCHSQSLLAI